jgi:hypothetical protein
VRAALADPRPASLAQTRRTSRNFLGTASTLRGAADATNLDMSDEANRLRSMRPPVTTASRRGILGRRRGGDVAVPLPRRESRRSAKSRRGERLLASLTGRPAAAGPPPRASRGAPRA